MPSQVQTAPVSPCELMAEYLRANLDPATAPGGIQVGPLNDAQQEQGAISIVESGFARIEKMAPLIWPRIQIRNVARALSEADAIAFKVHETLHNVERVVMTQPSSGLKFLVHQVVVTAGPSMHWDSPDTWETLMFVEMTVGTETVD